MKLDNILPLVTDTLSNAQKIELARIMLTQVRSYYDDNASDDNNYVTRSDKLEVALNGVEDYFSAL